MIDGNRRGNVKSSCPAADAGGGDPLDWLRREHDVQLELCSALEHIADGLPDTFDRRLVGEVIVVLAGGMARHFNFEEQQLFPILRQRASGDEPLLAALDQLEDEHARDSDLSDELVDQLKVLLAAGRVSNAEMLGYMLRGFFEGQRRHIEWENAILLPAARRLLSRDELTSLTAEIARGERRKTST